MFLRFLPDMESSFFYSSNYTNPLFRVTVWIAELIVLEVFNFTYDLFKRAEEKDLRVTENWYCGSNSFEIFGPDASTAQK